MIKISELLKNKRIRIISCSLILLILIVIIVLIILNNTSYEAKLKKELTNMGKDFYENYYYPGLGNIDKKDEILKNMSTIGIKVNLNNLVTYNNKKNEDKLEMFKNDKTKNECNKEETKVIIYPEKPYNNDNYKIEVRLDCGY